MAGKMDSAQLLPYEAGLEGESEFPGESMFRMVAESFRGVGFSMLNPAGVIVAWNSWATRMDGWSAEEVVGRHLSWIFSLDEVERGEPERWLRASRGSGQFEDEVWRTRKDGTRYWGMVTLTALREAGDGVSGYLLVTRDLSLKRAESEALRLAYERLNSMMNATADGILQISHDWRILYGNQRAAELITDFAVGDPFWETFPTVIGTPVADRLIRCMKERVTVIYENHFAPTNLWFRARAFPTEEGIGLFFSDITAEKTMQNQLALEQILREKRIEALSHMAGGLAHEINNPLAIIHARASDLKASVNGDAPVPAAEVVAACGSIVHTADRAIRVLRALQGFAREAGADPMHTVSAYDVLDQCVDLLESRFQRHHVELRVEMEPGIPMLHCRETQIRQIVTNLLNNALDAIDHAGIEPRLAGTEQERWVALRAHCADGLLVVDVMDSGPGIEDQFRAHVMDPFFTTKVRGMGMGVGLSLSRTIAQEHGGTLALLDETLEAGGATCFRLTLPLAKEEMVKTAHAADERDVGPGFRKGQGL